MNLRDLQRSFVTNLLGAGASPPGASMEGMSVYAHAYHSQLLTCLRDTHAKTREWIGEEAFDRAGKAYVSVHRPHSWSLDDYGDGFASYLGEEWPDDPDVGELAWLDWTLRRAFSGPDATPVAMASLTDVHWDDAVLTFAPTLRWRYVRSNVAALWRALDEETSPPMAAPGSVPPALRVWRHGFSTRFASMSAIEAACLDLATMGASFGEVCRDLAARVGEEEAASGAGSMLGDWLREGVVTAVR
ncbi:putative DNA-binding domain-containing protein [Pinirhizobacter soli]|uniref:HvfC/BufC family peptide modification chaperone n=1 Tax=Pinirhizobacter soli TaxID=2786953 RepID=UPI00202A31A3|nr:putative DNA-binding domain-containing protein [Pinirhizobacter soli]